MSLELYKKAPGGKLEINPLKNMTFPYYLCTDAPNTVIAVPAAGWSGWFPMTVSQEGPFEGFYFMGQYIVDPVNVLIEDMAARRRLMNREVHWDTIVGGTRGAAGDADVGFRPFILPQSLFLHQKRVLSVNFQDITGAGENVRFHVGGRRFYPPPGGMNDLDKIIESRLNRYEMAGPYFLTTDFPMVYVGAGTATWRMNIGPEGHFVGYKISYVTTTVADPTFYLTDPGTGRRIVHGQVAAGIMQNADGIGTALNPYVFPEPWFVPKNGAIDVTVTVAGAGTVYMTISGIRIYTDH